MPLPMPGKKAPARKRGLAPRKRLVPKKARKVETEVITSGGEGQDDIPAALALTPEEVRDGLTKLRKLLLSYANHKAVVKREGETADIQNDIIKKEMLRLGVQDVTATEKVDGHTRTVKAKLGDPPMTLVYDESKLRKALGAALWNKVSTRRLDERKLKALIKSGEVDTLTVAQCSEEVPGTRRLTYDDKTG